MMLSVVLGFLAVLSLVVMVWQVWVGFRFPLHHRPALSLSKGPPLPKSGPGITVLKPLKGCDSETAACLRSWLTQDYPGPLQFIFGVASPDDDVCQLVSSAMAEHPERAATLVICPERLGSNGKVSQLMQMERLIEHEIICVSDADVWVARDFLAHAVPSLDKPNAGIVSCLYRVASQPGLGMRWEALGANADFWSQVLQSLSLHAMHFALGAAMLTTRHQLQRVGGFAALADHLADDYELGHRLARTGAKAILSTEVVECRSAPLTFGEVWCHQLRWARTIRVCQPVPAFLSIIGNASLWPLLWVTLAPSALSFGFALLCLSFRQLAAALLERRFTGRVDASTWGMPVLKDLLQVLIWALSFSGKQVTWRGTRYRIEVSGKLIPLREVEAK